MKVLCISLPIESEAPVMVSVGETYEVFETFKAFGKWWYELTMQSGVGYGVWLFIPLSSIDETEFERNYKKELV